MGMQNPYVFHDYIEFVPSAYLDINYIATVAPKIVTRIQIMTNADADIFGFASNVFPSFICDPSAKGKYWYNRWGATPYTTLNKTIDHAADCIFGQYTVIDGDSMPAFPDTDWSTNTQSLRIGGGRNTNCDLKVFTFKYYDGDVLVRDMLPCLRKSDNAIGMFDKVTKTFFQPSGSVAPTLG
jgi:hypothetical protein